PPHLSRTSGLLCSASAKPGESPVARQMTHSSPRHDLQHFGELLRRFRVGAGLSQEALADRAGLSTHAVSDLERSTRRFAYPATAARLSSALELDESQSAELRSASRRRAPSTPAATAGPATSQALHADRHSTAVRHLQTAWRYPLVRSTVCPTLIGRATHGARLRNSLEAATLGKGQTVLIAGEAGMGKTRLAEQAAASAPEL